MPEETELPHWLSRGLEALQGLPWIELSGRPRWRWKEKLWAIPCRIDIVSADSDLVPQRTSWWLTARENRLRETLDFYPAKEDGLATTFPHQSRNDVGPASRPWREGKLCLPVNIQPLRRLGLEPEARPERWVWHAERAREWLLAASRNELLPPGEPFELPDFQPITERLVFSESTRSLERWQAIDARSGYVQMRRRGKMLIARKFVDVSHRPVHSPTWGAVEDHWEKSAWGIWVKLDELPVLPPWKAPSSWGELLEACRAPGFDLEAAVMERVGERFRESRSQRSARPRHPLLLGFPIPDQVGGDPTRMHWIGFPLPQLTARRDTVPGFRTTPKDMRSHDVKHLRQMKPIPWFVSSCWGNDDLIGRGSLSSGLRTTSALLIGAGSLGSVLGELLVRSGVREITVVDGESLEAGNLVRHTLELRHVDAPKAQSVASRLRQIAPEVDALGIDSKFTDRPVRFRKRTDRAELVIDATASNELLRELDALPADPDRVFVSVSLGVECRRLYLFAVRASSFPYETFERAIKPWVDDDWRDIRDDVLPREGAGCWQPLLPGTMHHITMLAAAAVEVLDEMSSERRPGSEPVFVVLERIQENARFVGIRRRRGSEAPSGEGFP